MNTKFEPTKYSPDMTYGDWDKLFLNDLVILGKSAVWMESGIPGAAPSRLPNATTKARLAQVCKSNTERCALIGVTDPDEIDALAANRLTEDHIEDWKEAVAQNRKDIDKHSTRTRRAVGAAHR